MTADRIAAIRARIEAATPGPFRHRRAQDIWAIEAGVNWVGNAYHEADAALFAHAPEDLEWLLSEVDAYQHNESGYEEAIEIYERQGTRDRLEYAAKLERENQKLREALEKCHEEIVGKLFHEGGDLIAALERADEALAADKERGV